jgi:hypothetical protein
MFGGLKRSSGMCEMRHAKWSRYDEDAVGIRRWLSLRNPRRADQPDLPYPV